MVILQCLEYVSCCKKKQEKVEKISDDDGTGRKKDEEV